MLIDQDGVAIGIGEHEVCRAGGGFIGGGVGGELTLLGPGNRGCRFDLALLDGAAAI